jgi:hypothetical protein
VPVHAASGRRADWWCSRLNAARDTGSLRDSVIAGSIAAALSAAPSTVHALATHGDPWAATRAAGSILLPHQTRRTPLLAAGTFVHATLSLGWALVIRAVLPRRHPVAAGAAAGLTIAALDLGIVGSRLPGIRALALWPQVADHVAYGMIVAEVLARRRTGASAGAFSRLLGSRRRTVLAQRTAHDRTGRPSRDGSSNG